MRKLWEGDIPSPRTEKPDIDEEFARIIEKATASDPDQRYDSALDLQADLERYAETLGPPVKQKDIGALVSSLFEAPRNELRQLIETQLKQLESGEDSFAGVPIVGVPDVNPSTTRRHEERSSSRWLPFLVALLLAAAALIGVLGQRELTDRSVARQAAPVPVATAPRQTEEAEPEKTTPKLATIRFSVTPTEAEADVYFDDVKLSSGTVSKVIPVDRSVHVLRAEADGYRPASVEFSADEDKTIELQLKEEPRARSAVIRRGRRAPKPTTAGQSSAAPEPAPAKAEAPACSNPFFIDSAGIKRVRAECR
jgi:serine/threonine-protein kinase